MRLAKMTSKNQLTIPQWAVDELGQPTHFRVLVREGVLLLWPGHMVCAADRLPGKAVAPARAQDSSGKTAK